MYVNTSRTWVKEGYTVVDHIDELQGYYKSADGKHSLEIVKASTKLYATLDGSVYFAKGNYNNSVLTISVDGKSMTITKDGASVLYKGADESISFTSATLTYDVDASKLEGTWELYHYYYYTFKFGADGKLVATRMSEYGTTTKTVDYTVTDNLVKFNFYYCDYICTFEGGSLTVLEDNSSIGTARKIAELPVVLDAFAGTWSGKSFASTVEMVLDGKGSGTFAGNAITYTVKGDTIEFTCSGHACVVTKSGDKLNFTCDDAEWMADFTLTKQA